MRVFALDFSRISNFVAGCFVRWKHQFTHVKLDGLSDRSLKDIGLEPYRRDFDAVKPFWMP